jgi:hypothetical protein
MTEACLKCGLPEDDLFHHAEHLGGTGTWGSHVFVGAAEKLLLQYAIREMQMAMKAGIKGAHLLWREAAWNVAILAAKERVERMWLPVDMEGMPIQPALDSFKKYFAKEYAARALALLPAAPQETK